MKKLLLIIGITSLCLCSCTQEPKADPFIINATHVGLLTKEVKINQLDSVFAKDSIAKIRLKDGFNAGNEISIYDKKGNKLLVLSPARPFDSTSTIANIEIVDSRYKTAKGFNIKSTFKDIQKNYKISRIENTLRTAVIFVDELNAYVTIDKSVLSGNAKYNTDEKIEPTQIPDDAKIEHFWVGWQ